MDFGDGDSDGKLGTFGTRLAGNIVALLGSAFVADVPGILINSFGIANNDGVGERIKTFLFKVTNGRGRLPILPFKLPRPSRVKLPSLAELPELPSVKDTVSNAIGDAKDVISDLRPEFGIREGFKEQYVNVKEFIKNNKPDLPTIQDIKDHLGNIQGNLGGRKVVKRQEVCSDRGIKLL